MATLQITQKSGNDLNTQKHGDSLINYVYPDVVSECFQRIFDDMEEREVKLLVTY